MSHCLWATVFSIAWYTEMVCVYREIPGTCEISQGVPRESVAQLVCRNIVGVSESHNSYRYCMSMLLVALSLKSPTMGVSIKYCIVLLLQTNKRIAEN